MISSFFPFYLLGFDSARLRERSLLVRSKAKVKTGSALSTGISIVLRSVGICFDKLKLFSCEAPDGSPSCSHGINMLLYYTV